MLKVLMIGVILFLALSCRPVTIKKPVKMYAVSLEFDEVAVGYKNLNIRDKAKSVGEWTGELDFIPLDEAPLEMMCFTQKTWLTIIKPKLKEGARQYRDRKSR